MFDNFEYFGNFDGDRNDDDCIDGDDHDDDNNVLFTSNFLSCNNAINVANCLCPKWLLCASVSDTLRYRAAVAVKKILFPKKKCFLEKMKKN